MVALPQLPELPAYSESRGASDLPYGRGVATSRKVVPLKSGAPLVPSSAWEVVTGPSSSCPRASVPVNRLLPKGSGPPTCKQIMNVVALVWRGVGVEPAFRGLLACLKIIQKLTVLKGQNSREFFFRVFLWLLDPFLRGLLAVTSKYHNFLLLKGQDSRQFFFRRVSFLKCRMCTCKVSLLKGQDYRQFSFGRFCA